MASWENFEKFACSYIQENFITKNVGLSIVKKGGSDAESPDLCIKKYNKEVLNIEVKNTPSQSGQFVLHPNFETKKFEFSRLNRFVKESVKGTDEIINFLNEDFLAFSETHLLPININNEILKKWVVSFYKEHKNVSYVFFGDADNFFISPTENIFDYLSVSAVYRVKKSGSRSYNYAKPSILIGGKHFDVISHQKKAFLKNYPTFSVEDKKKINKFLSDENLYVNPQGNGELRKLSSTQNKNVIFSLHLNENIHQNKEHLRQFKNSIESV